MPPSSLLRSPLTLPRRATLLGLALIVFIALMLTTSLRLHKKTLDNFFEALAHGELTREPQHDYGGYKSERLSLLPVVSEHGFESALHNLTHLAPDEARVAQLLSPIDHSKGTAMLKDLAVRTRLFDTLFTAWENLHITPSATLGEVSIRQNIVERIRHSSLSRRSEAIQRYDTMRSFMNQFARHLFPWTAGQSPDHMLLHTTFAAGGRGIVITVGDHQIAYVLTSIKTFRELGCNLPVEVFFLGDGDLRESSREALARLPEVITRDLSRMVIDDGWTLKGKLVQAFVSPDLDHRLTLALAGWAAKPMALLLSSFREAILIDADVLFFVDPATLLSDPEYLRFGALFFRDRLFDPTDRADFVTEALPQPLSQNILQSNRWWAGTSLHMQESGVVVVDKWRHFVALLLATRLNGPDRDGNDAGKTGVYQMMHGDKETFWLAWEMAGDTDYAFYDGRAGQIGAVAPKSAESGDEGKGEMCGKQLLHTSREGRPLWFNGWIATDKHQENHLTSFQDFQGFITEPQETERWSSHYWNGWMVREGNIMCLASEGYTPLSAEENKIVKMILRAAEKVVATGV